MINGSYFLDECLLFGLVGIEKFKLLELLVPQEGLVAEILVRRYQDFSLSASYL